jgi:hypothetical protein
MLYFCQYYTLEINTLDELFKKKKITWPKLVGKFFLFFLTFNVILVP